MIQIVCYTTLTLQVEMVIKMSSNRTRPRIVLLSQTAAMFEWGNTTDTTRSRLEVSSFVCYARSNSIFFCFCVFTLHLYDNLQLQLKTQNMHSFSTYYSCKCVTNICVFIQIFSAMNALFLQLCILLTIERDFSLCSRCYSCC